MHQIIWKEIEGYEDRYKVSNYGEVISIARKYRKNDKVLNQYSDLAGYKFVSLSKHNKKNIFGVHRLIALAFIPNPENKPEVNHKNGIKWDNHVDNLEWATTSENCLHAFRTGLSKPHGAKWRVGAKNKLSKRVKQIDLKTKEVIKIWDSASDVKREKGWNNRSICACALNVIPTAFGFNWEYEI